MKPIVPLKLHYFGLLLITLLFPSRNAQATVADTLTVERVVDYAVTALIEQDEKNRENERTGKAHLNEYTITLDLQHWMDEQGKQTKILDAAQFSNISKKLQDFNRRPDQLRMYVVLVNDYEVKFKAKLDAGILKDGFKWNDLQQHPEQQKTVKGLWQKTASIVEGVATALKAAGFDERVVYFYSHLRVEEYNQTPHFFHYDRLKFFGARLPPQESKIRQHVKTTKGASASRVDLAVSSLITSIEAVVDNGYTSNSSLVAFANSPSHALPDNDFSKIPEGDFTRFAQLADAALGKSAIKWDQTKKTTDYKHVNVPEAFKKSTASQLRDFEIEALEDKLRYLSEVTNTHFYVTVAPFWYDLNQQQRDRFAAEVFKRTRKLSGLEKVVLITIPFYNQQYLNMAALTTDPIKTGSVAQPGIYAKGVDIDLAFVTSTIGGPYEFVFNAYKHLSKPYSNFVYGLQADGTVKMLQGRAEAYVKGFEAIEELVLLRDQNIDHLASVHPVHAPPDFNKPPYIGPKADPRRYHNDLDTYRRYLVALQAAIDNPKWEVDEDGKRLKEPFVKTHHKNFVKEFISSDAAFLSKFGNNVNWSVLLTEQSLVGKQYDFRLASRYVKPAADKFWFIPLVPNAVCLTWAKAEGDYVLADQAAVDLTLEISINLATYGAGKSLTSGLQLVKGTRAYTKVATNWIVLSGRQVSEAVVERAVRRYALNAAEKAVLTGCSDDVLASLASEGNQKLIAGLSKDDFLRYVRTLADATGVSDLVIVTQLPILLTAKLTSKYKRTYDWLINLDGKVSFLEKTILYKGENMSTAVPIARISEDGTAIEALNKGAIALEDVEEAGEGVVIRVEGNEVENVGIGCKNGNCGVVGGTCFPAATPIWTAHGIKAIEQIKAGEQVWAKDVQSGQLALKKVVKTFARRTNRLINVYAGGGLLCQPTPEHPFWVKNGFVPVGKLKAGDSLSVLCTVTAGLSALPAGSFLVIDSLVKKDTIITVYNLEVADWHNYLVGREGILVHNADYGLNDFHVDLLQKAPRGNSQLDRVFKKNIVGKRFKINFGGQEQLCEVVAFDYPSDLEDLVAFTAKQVKINNGKEYLSGEIITILKSHAAANGRAEALQITKRMSNHADDWVPSTHKYTDNTIINGFEYPDEVLKSKYHWYIDFDSGTGKGAHYNWVNGNTKGAVLFNSTEESINYLKLQMTKTYGK